MVLVKPNNRLARNRSLMQLGDKRLTATQAGCKGDLDKRVRRFNTDIMQGEFLFVQRESATQSEERLKTSRGEAIGNHKVHSKASGPFPTVIVATHTITVMRDGIADKISKDLVIRSPSPQRQNSGGTECDTQVGPADCTTLEALSTATPWLTGSSKDALLYPGNKVVDLQRMPTNI